MAEEKPFEATPSKIRRARAEGNVPRSPELNSVVSFAAGTGAASVALPMLLALSANVVARSAQGLPDDAGLYVFIAALTLVPLVAAAVAGVVVGVLQMGGPVFVAPSMKFERLKPDEGFKRMFSRESAVAAARSTLVFAMAGAALAWIIEQLLASGAAGSYEAGVFAIEAGSATRTVVFTLVGIGLAFGIVDVIMAYNRWRKKLRMDFYELKRDLSETEGNPHIKGRRRSMHRALVAGSLQKVPDASFVVTNPTHLAIALQYRPPEVAVPIVLCMAADDGAAVVREQAQEHHIPLVENVELAWTLYETAQIGRAIPKDTFVAVAEIVSAFMRSGVLQRAST